MTVSCGSREQNLLSLSSKSSCEWRSPRKVLKMIKADFFSPNINRVITLVSTQSGFFFGLSCEEAVEASSGAAEARIASFVSSREAAGKKKPNSK